MPSLQFTVARFGNPGETKAADRAAVRQARPDRLERSKGAIK